MVCFSSLVVTVSAGGGCPFCMMRQNIRQRLLASASEVDSCRVRPSTLLIQVELEIDFE